MLYVKTSFKHLDLSRNGNRLIARGSTPDLLNGDDHFAYVVGYQDGRVHPNALITRAETATILKTTAVRIRASSCPT